MKKIIFICMLVPVITQVKAQFGIQAGAGFYGGRLSTSGISLNYKLKPGFTAGILYNVPVAGNISFMPSINLTQKGGKYHDNFFGPELEDKLTLNYIDVQLNFVYNVNGYFIGAGPALGFGVGGKDKNNIDTVNSSSDVHFGNGDDDDFRPFEISANILAGYKFNNGIFISINFNPGINNIVPDDEYNSKFHTNGLAIRVGYMFSHAMHKKTSSSSTQ